MGYAVIVHSRFLPAVSADSEEANCKHRAGGEMGMSETAQPTVSTSQNCERGDP